MSLTAKALLEQGQDKSENQSLGTFKVCCLVQCDSSDMWEQQGMDLGTHRTVCALSVLTRRLLQIINHLEPNCKMGY